MNIFKVGDRVDVYDLRDGAKVETAAVIQSLKSEMLPGGKTPRLYASLSCGFAVSVRCLAPTGRPHAINVGELN